MSNAYLNYAAKRLVQAVVVILLAYVFTFVVVSILPGDPDHQCPERESAERVHAKRRSRRSSPPRVWTSRSHVQLWTSFPAS
jgi:peptide/nickel transport system permease protein